MLNPFLLLHPLLFSHPYLPTLSLTYSVTDSLDDVLKIADKKKAPPKKVSPLSNSDGRGLFDLEDTKDTATEMEGGDIMKYIQQNMDAADDDDLDLF